MKDTTYTIRTESDLIGFVTADLGDDPMTIATCFRAMAHEAAKRCNPNYRIIYVHSGDRFMCSWTRESGPNITVLKGPAPEGSVRCKRTESLTGVGAMCIKGAGHTGLHCDSRGNEWE